MRLLCPNCREVIDAEALACPNGHRFICRSGVLSLLAESFGRELRPFLESFQAVRAAERKRRVDPAIYDRLPFIPADMGDVQFQLEWRLRQSDLVVVADRLRERPRSRVLDIGAWNGWLSHQLARRGHEVTAIDYFSDEYDGLGARRFYSTQWSAIQMDLLDLAVIDMTFDAIIVNRCLQFLPDPIAYVGSLRHKLSAGGQLIITGLPFFQDPRWKAQRVIEMQQAHRARYGFDLFLRPAKGYLDFGDKRCLEASGIEMKRYPQLWRASLRAMVDRTRPLQMYGVYTACP